MESFKQDKLYPKDHSALLRNRILSIKKKAEFANTVSSGLNYYLFDCIGSGDSESKDDGKTVSQGLLKDLLIDLNETDKILNVTLISIIKICKGLGYTDVLEKLKGLKNELYVDEDSDEISCEACEDDEDEDTPTSKI